MRVALTPPPTLFGAEGISAGRDSSGSTALGNPVGARPRPFHERDPWGEKAHNFLCANGFGAASDAAPSRWVHLTAWTIAELGTGTGCTLACLLAAFERHATTSQRLAYVGFERDPSMLDWWRDPSSHAAIPGPERSALHAILAKPLRATQGITRWSMLGGRATITLVLGDAQAWLPQLDFRADAWFLDAFEPAVEHRLWSPDVLRRIALLTKPGGTASTFSAAAAVRSGLDAAGFDVQRVAGFDTKRHMTVATRRSEPGPSRDDPWFAPPPPTRPERVTILGAGLAGAWCARACAERGAQVTVVDPRSSSGRASDVPLAAAAQPEGSWQSEVTRVHDAAWHLLVDRCRDLGLPHRMLPIAAPSGPTARLALLATPSELIEGLLGHPRILVAHDAPHESFTVHATAFATDALDGTVCSVAGPAPNGGSMGRYLVKDPSCAAVMDEGYALPAHDGLHAWIGATNHPGLAVDDGSASMHGAVNPARDWPALDAIAGRLVPGCTARAELWSGTRAASHDHLPLVGPIAHARAFAAAFGAIRHGPRAQDWPACPYEPGMWCSIGHGSHGMLTTPLAAELIADLAFGTPRCITDELLRFLLPQRFALRELRRARGR